MIEDYFGPIPRGEDIVRNFPKEDPITEPINAVAYDANIQIPAIMAYRTPSFKDRESYVLDMISTYLSDGKPQTYKKLVDDKKMALQAGAINSVRRLWCLYFIWSTVG